MNDAPTLLKGHANDKGGEEVQEVREQLQIKDGRGMNTKGSASVSQP
jgi:hypothetical protein